MTFINTDGMSFLGPGSEWFWSMLQLIVVVVSLGGLYRQLRAQGAANALQRMEALQGRWDSARMTHTRLVVALWRKAAGDAPPSVDAQAALSHLCGFFEDLYELEHDGFLTWSEIEFTWGEVLVSYWLMLAPAIMDLRRHTASSYTGFERLAARAEAAARKRGDDWPFSESQLPELIESQIGRNTARLRLLRDVAAGVIPSEQPGSVEPAGN